MLISHDTLFDIEFRESTVINFCFLGDPMCFSCSLLIFLLPCYSHSCHPNPLPHLPKQTNPTQEYIRSRSSTLQIRSSAFISSRSSQDTYYIHTRKCIPILATKTQLLGLQPSVASPPHTKIGKQQRPDSCLSLLSVEGLIHPGTSAATIRALLLRRETKRRDTTTAQRRSPRRASG